MDTFEARELLDESVCCLARMMDQIRLRETEKVMGWDEPMQDHLAQCTWAHAPYEGDSFEDCIEYLQRLRKGFIEAYEHESKAEDVAAKNGRNYDITHICDMVMGGIFHNFPDDLVECAKEISKVADSILPPGKVYKKNDKHCNRLLGRFISKAEKIIKDHDQQYWEEGRFSLPLAYLVSWMERRYWKD